MTSRSYYTKPLEAAKDAPLGKKVSVRITTEGKQPHLLYCMSTCLQKINGIAVVTITLLAGGCSRARTSPDPLSVLPSSGVSLLAFGSAGKGSDDTAVLQKAITQSALSGKVLTIPAAGIPYKVMPLKIPSKAHIILNSGVIIEALPGYTELQKMINIVDSNDVEIVGYGATVRMNSSEYKTGEYRHCVYISGSTDVHLKGFRCVNAAGDGLYIAGSDTKPFSDNIYVDGLTAQNNRRQGLTIISAKNVWIRQSQFINSRGTAPESGIDIEPERATDCLENIHIEDNETEFNAGDGVRIALGNLNHTSSPVSVTVARHRDKASGRNSLFGSSETRGASPVRGVVLIDHFSSENAALYGVVFSFWNSSGPKVTVQSSTVLNANQLHATDDNTAIAVIRGGGGIGSLGNIAFIDTSIRDTSKEPRLNHYFTFMDYSHVGIEKVEFSSPGTLTGARVEHPLGLFQGRGVETLSATDVDEIAKLWRAAEHPTQTPSKSALTTSASSH